LPSRIELDSNNVIASGSPKEFYVARLVMLLGALLSFGSGCRQRVDPVVADIARDMQRVAPASGFRIASARGEDRTLILQVEVDADGALAWDAAGVAHSFATVVCATPRDANFFSEGRTLRVELSAPGRAATNAIVSRCPGPAGQGLTMDTMVEILRPMVGRDLGDGAKVTSVRADGQTLVMVMDGRPGWRTGLDQTTFAWAVLEGACDRPGGFRLFDGTRTLRIDTTEGGNNLIQGQIISRCPAPPAGRP
jgi:hypothetical protein